MAVTLSGNGIIFANGDLQNFAGIGAQTKINRAGSLITPKWKVIASVIENTLYFPSSTTEEVCFVSVIFEIGVNEDAVLDLFDPDAGLYPQIGEFSWLGAWPGNARTVYTVSTIVPPFWGWRISTSGNILSALEWKSS